MQLEGKLCIVAGASGAIGTAVASAFMREGARVILTSHSTPADHLAAESGCLMARKLDVSDSAAVKALVGELRERCGAIHALVNCTGIQGPIGPSQEVDSAAWSRTIEINLNGAFYLMQAVIPVMIAQGGGKIINFSGGGAAYGRPFFAAYGASKAALVRLTETLAMELADANVQLNAIAPGPVRSRMWDELRQAGASAGVRALAELSQMDREGGVPPERGAALAVFLASERSGKLSGKLISCLHDKWEQMDEARLAELAQSETWTLRRVNPR